MPGLPVRLNIVLAMRGKTAAQWSPVLVRAVPLASVDMYVATIGGYGAEKEFIEYVKDLMVELEAVTIFL